MASRLEISPEPEVEWSELVEEETRLRAIREFLARDDRRRRRRRLAAYGVVVGVGLVVGATAMVQLVQHQTPWRTAEIDRPNATAADNPEAFVRRESATPTREALVPRESPAPTPEPVAPRESVTTEREPLARPDPLPPTRDVRPPRDVAPARDVTPSREALTRREPPAVRPEPPAAPKPAIPAPPAPRAVATKPAPAPGASAPLEAAAPPSRAAARSRELPPRTALPVRSPAIAPPAPTPAPPSPLASVGYHPQGRLTSIQVGDTKDKVFGLLATSFERQNGSLMRIEGIRLRASARSPRHARVEIAEARIGETSGAARYWFLFGDERLLAWGRPDEWKAAAGRFQVESAYAPDASRSAAERQPR
jgi:hypothetical protein